MAESSPKKPESKAAKSPPFTADANSAIVRYQVRDLDRSSGFYTRHLGFEDAGRHGPVAILRRGDLRLILSGPGASGSRALPGGRSQEPGGSNRIVLYLETIAPAIAALRADGVHFRNEVEVGPGGKQILVDDPDGNPIELHEAPEA